MKNNGIKGYTDYHGLLKNDENYIFKLEKFEGPLDYLLYLIQKSEIDIYDIPIHEITEQYLKYINLMKKLDVNLAAEFIIMAGSLIHIKSKMLLPPEEKQTEEPAEDPRTELVQRLLEYQAFREASSKLREREDIWKNIFKRNFTQAMDFDEPDLLPFEASVFDLVSAFKNLLSKAPEQILEITRETLTVADRISFIMETVEGKDGIKFEDLFEQTFTKINFIVTFLALLELIRLGLIKAFQDTSFGSIWIINAQQIKTSPQEASRSGR